MTDKLPEWVESWIDDNELFGVVDAQLIRAFLAQYVLCAKEPAAFAHDDFTGAVMFTDAKSAIIKDYARLGLPMAPLHAPAKEKT